MSDVAKDGVHLTKEYYKDFLPTDLPWEVTNVDDDFTLYDLFRLVYHVDMMIPGIAATMGMTNFEAFWKQIQLDHNDRDIENIKYLELYWQLEYDVRTTKKTGKSTDQITSNCAIIRDNNKNYWDDPKVADLSNLMGLHGVGDGCPSKELDLHECGDDCPNKTGYGIEFTPINHIADLPIRVSPKISFFPPYVESNRDFHRTGFEIKIYPTLWCFITSIFWELTFVGCDPEQVETSRSELTDMVDDAVDHLKQMREASERDVDEEDIL